MRTFIENYLHFMKNCIRPHYEKLKPLKSGFIDNSNFENYRDPCILRNGNVTTIEMGDSEVATEKLLYHISRLGRTNYSHWLLTTINYLIPSCRPHWQLP